MWKSELLWDWYLLFFRDHCCWRFNYCRSTGFRFLVVQYFSADAVGIRHTKGTCAWFRCHFLFLLSSTYICTKSMKVTNTVINKLILIHLNHSNALSPMSNWALPVACGVRKRYPFRIVHQTSKKTRKPKSEPSLYVTSWIEKKNSPIRSWGGLSKNVQKCPKCP